MAVPLEAETQQQLRDLGADDGDVVVVTLACQRVPAKRGAERMSYHVPPDVRLYKTRLMSMRDSAFQLQFGFERGVLQRRVLNPLAAEIRRVEQLKARKRRKELDIVMRCLRFIELMRGRQLVDMVRSYGQSRSTVHNDFYLWLAAARRVLVPLWISMPLAGSAEYQALVGAGVFARRLPMVVYNADMTFVEIEEPDDSDIQREFYSGKYKSHGLLFLSFIDGFGRTGGIAGPFVGCTHDKTAIVQADLVERMERYVLL